MAEAGATVAAFWTAKIVKSTLDLQARIAISQQLPFLHNYINTFYSLGDELKSLNRTFDHYHKELSKGKMENFHPINYSRAVADYKQKIKLQDQAWSNWKVTEDTIGTAVRLTAREYGKGLKADIYTVREKISRNIAAINRYLRN